MSLQNQIVDTLINGAGSGLVDGELVRVSANKTVARASAAAPTTVAGFIGAVSTSSVIGVGGIANVVVGGVARVRMETGLTLAAGQTLYVSATVAGAATNVEPAGNAVAFGVIKDTTGYATATPYVVAEIGSLAGSTASGGATWDINTFRYYAVDYAGGSDANVGYSDVSMADAGTKALKTLTQLRRILPGYGDGRKVVIAVKGPSDGTQLQYLKPDGVTLDDLDFRGVSGYSIFIARTTRTFANDTTDKILCAPAFGQQGPNSDGSWAVAAGATTSVFTTAGGSPNLNAEPALTGMRIRFKGNVTAALANVCRYVWKNTTTTITVGSTDLPTSPAAGDEFFIEWTGVVVNNILAGPNANGPRPGGTSTAFPNASVVGFNALQSTNQLLFFQGTDVALRVAFCDFQKRMSAGSINELRVGGIWLDENNAQVQSGYGVRHRQDDTAQIIGNANQLTYQDFAVLGTNNTPTFARCKAWTIGSGVSATGLTFSNSTLPGRTAQSRIGDGTTLSATTRRMRIFGNAGKSTGAGSGVLTISASGIDIDGLDISNAGANACIGIQNGQNVDIVVGDLQSADGGNTDVALDVTAVVKGRVVVRGTNTMTGTAGDVRAAGPIIYSWAALSADEYRDAAGNVLSTGAPTNITKKVTAGTAFNVPVLAADPAAPADGDVWIKNTGGVRTLNARIAGVTYASVLT